MTATPQAASTTEFKLRRAQRLQGEIQRLEALLSPLRAELGLDRIEPQLDVWASRIGDCPEWLC